MDDLVEIIRRALAHLPDSAALEVRLVGDHIATLKSLEGDAAKRARARARATFAANIVNAVAPRRGVTRVLVCGGGIRVDVPIVAPSHHIPLRSGERIIY